jgi:hypothetical protein
MFLVYPGSDTATDSDDIETWVRAHRPALPGSGVPQPEAQ